MGKEENKMQNKDVESPFCIIHSPTVSGHSNFTSLDNGKDVHLRKNGRVYIKSEMRE